MMVQHYCSFIEVDWDHESCHLNIMIRSGRSFKNMKTQSLVKVVCSGNTYLLMIGVAVFTEVLKVS